MRYAICYVSTVSGDVSLEEIKNILDTAARRNNEHDIRGVLLYAEGNFFEVLEGEKKLVEDMYATIQKDPRHKNIIQVVGKNVKHGAFDGFKAEVVDDSNKCDYELVKEYMEQVEGLDSQTQGVVKGMLEVFIDTH
ncbi:hypothetical protein BH23BAC2_BH23BAC2_24960 [soil metagenome]